jgi:hypothetical protein
MGRGGLGRADQSPRWADGGRAAWSTPSRPALPNPRRARRRGGSRGRAGACPADERIHLVDLGDEPCPDGGTASPGRLGGALLRLGHTTLTCAPDTVGVMAIEDSPVLPRIGYVVAHAGQPLEGVEGLEVAGDLRPLPVERVEATLIGHSKGHLCHLLVGIGGSASRDGDPVLTLLSARVRLAGTRTCQQGFPFAPPGAGGHRGRRPHTRGSRADCGLSRAAKEAVDRRQDEEGEEGRGHEASDDDGGQGPLDLGARAGPSRS